MLHYLIVFPCYFFAALSGFLLLTMLARIARLKVGASTLATVAVIVAIGAVALPLALDWVDLTDLSGRYMIAIAIGTILLAGIDTLLQAVLPLPLDHELSEF